MKMCGTKFFVVLALSAMISASLIEITESGPIFNSISGPIQNFFGYHGGFFSPLYPRSNTPQDRKSLADNIQKLIDERYYTHKGNGIMGVFG